MTEKKVAIVTGASSGFGLLTAERLSRQGYRIFGTSRKECPETAQGVEMPALDVRSDDSVRECVGRVLEAAGYAVSTATSASPSVPSRARKATPAVVPACVGPPEGGSSSGP